MDFSDFCGKVLLPLSILLGAVLGILILK